mgnify:CR=1 FL=1
MKRRSKVTAEFNLSSSTDVIFLLLIFFMLTSNFVADQPFELHKSDSKTVAATTVVISIDKDGVFTMDNVEIDARALDRVLRTKLSQAKEDKEATVTIVAEVGTPFENVVKVMNAAARLKAKAIIATQPNS